MTLHSPQTRTTAASARKRPGVLQNASFAATYLLESRELCDCDVTRLDFFSIREKARSSREPVPLTRRSPRLRGPIPFLGMRRDHTLDPPWASREAPASTGAERRGALDFPSQVLEFVVVSPVMATLDSRQFFPID
jgi:hypothetical protein